MNVLIKPNPCFHLQQQHLWKRKDCCGDTRTLRFGKIWSANKLVMNCKVRDERNITPIGDCRTTKGGKKNDKFVEMMREAWPYFQAYRGRIFVLVLCAEVIQSPNLGAILEDISLLHGLGTKFVLVPGTHVQIDKLLAEKGCQPKYVGRYRVTDPDSLEAAMDSAGRTCFMIQCKLSPVLEFKIINT